MSSADPHYLEVRLTRASLRRGGRQVLRDESWVVRPGERWVLAGGNGAGKTQLLKVLAGIDAPTRHALARRVLALSARSTAVVLATHRPDEWRESATHELELAAGRARYCGPVRAVRAVARSGGSRAR
jgi:ABC-type molybdenum transport system ATPase subunit/photorepair protein PhrA